MRGATYERCTTDCTKRFQSTHLMRGATYGLEFLGRDTVISIHAPHARCDFVLNSPQPSQQISIHAPHARCDFTTFSTLFNSVLFQSTHLMRGATSPSLYLPKLVNFNPRTSCEVRHVVTYSQQMKHLISIHAPHARCDITQGSHKTIQIYFNPRTSCEVRPPLKRTICKTFVFQSTHLMRGATC